MRTLALLLLLASACVTIVVRPETCPASPASPSANITGAITTADINQQVIMRTAESNQTILGLDGNPFRVKPADPWLPAVVHAPPIDASWLPRVCACTLLLCSNSPCNTCTCSLPDGGFEKVPSW